MKFVSVKSAKGLTPGKQVYTLNEKGEYGVARLATKTEDQSGTHFKFEVPQYYDHEAAVSEPVHIENVTHVHIPKDRTEADANN